MSAIDLSHPIDPQADDEAYRLRVQLAIRRERWRWSQPIPCPACGEWIGHWGGDATRQHCNLIPLNVPLEEVRPNCVMPRYHRIGDAIRAATGG